MHSCSLSFQNILLDAEGRAKLADFGISRVSAGQLLLLLRMACNATWWLAPLMFLLFPVRSGPAGINPIQHCNTHPSSMPAGEGPYQELPEPSHQRQRHGEHAHYLLHKLLGGAAEADTANAAAAACPVASPPTCCLCLQPIVADLNRPASLPPHCPAAHVHGSRAVQRQPGGREGEGCCTCRLHSAQCTGCVLCCACQSAHWLTLRLPATV